MVRILAFAGSSRRDSFNRKLVDIAASGAGKAGAEVTLVNLGEFPMPIINQDLEESEGMPEKAREFKELMVSHDGFLIASPEYNSFFSPLLKNALDWASRKEAADEPPLVAYRGKKAAILAASPGGFGGMRGLIYLRMLLSGLGVFVLPEQVSVPGAFNAFNSQGDLLDQKLHSAVMGLGEKLVEFCEMQIAGKE